MQMINFALTKHMSIVIVGSEQSPEGTFVYV